MSRSIGDVAAHEIGVSALPVVMQYRLSEADRLLVIATDGVWDMLDNSEVVDIAARASGDCKGDPAYAAAQVCQTARRAWEFKETRVDDITCLLVFLQHWPCRRSEAPGAASSAEALDRPVIPDSVDTSPQASQEAYQAYGRLEADASHKWMPSSPSAQARPSPSYSYPPLTRQTHDSAQEYSLGSPQKHSQQAHWQVAAASSQVSYIALSQDVYAGQGSLEQSDKAPLAPPHPTMQPPGPAQNVDASSKLPHRPPVPAPREVWASTYRPWMAPGRHPPQASATAERGVGVPRGLDRGDGSMDQPRPAPAQQLPAKSYFDQAQVGQKPPGAQPSAGAPGQYQAEPEASQGGNGSYVSFADSDDALDNVCLSRMTIFLVWLRWATRAEREETLIARSSEETERRKESHGWMQPRRGAPSLATKDSR